MSAWTRLWSARKRRWRLEDGVSEAATPPKRARARPGGLGRPARLLCINQYYWPDHASTAQHLTDLAESLAARGHEVHVLCSRGSYRPGEPPRPACEVHNGVHIHRVGATALGRRSSLTRMADYLSFYATAALRALRLPRFDVVVTLTTPPIIGLLGTILRRLRGSHHLYWSMDLHPDASLALGRMSRSSPVVRLLAWLSDAVYRHADHVVVLGPYMADRVAAKGVRPSRLVTIPVWSRRDEIYPLPRAGHPLRERLGLADKFVVLYSGNLGLAHRFDEFLEAARRLRDHQEMVFLYVGGGPRLSEVREVCRREGLDNVRLMDYFPREELYASLSTADVHLISLRSEVTGLVVPSKLYGAMASGRPALFVGPAHCETADTIRQTDCGLTLRSGDTDGLVEALVQLAASPADRDRMGENGRSAFLAEFERDHCCAQWGWLIGELIGAPALPIATPHTLAGPASRRFDRPFRRLVGRGH